MILVRDHKTVRELQLNRPPANALNRELMTELRRAVEAAPQDGARALVLSGRPGMFSAGLDIPLLLTLDRKAISDLWRSLYSLLRSLASSPIPIAAAITGHAPAGGTVLAIFCDWRIVAEGDWKIGLSEVQVGLPLPPIIFLALRRLVSAQQAQQLATRGLLVSPAQALQVGLVDQVVPPDQVVSAAIDWCETLLALPQNAAAYTRREARADLTEIFAQDRTRELEELSAAWWEPETHSVLRQMAERLKNKK